MRDTAAVVLLALDVLLLSVGVCLVVLACRALVRARRPLEAAGALTAVCGLALLGVVLGSTG